MSDSQIDETHAPDRRSWIGSANDPLTDFPIQNLPFGVFRRRGSGASGRIGVAIGDRILDLAGLADRLAGEADAALLAAPSLAPLMGREPRLWRALRKALVRALEAGSPQQGAVEPHLVAMSEADMLLPVRPGGFVDFFASLQHATNAGRLFRPTAPLLPNYKYVPIGYNGRASTIGIDGAEIRRPNGQRLLPGGSEPAFGPSLRLDYEMELGIFLGGASATGEPVPIGGAWRHVFGFCLLNDWSARDIQAWEYQPLGPFLGKSFATTISPWIVTAEALAPFRTAACARSDGDPAPLPYLADPRDQRAGGVDIAVSAWLRTAAMTAAGMPALRLGTASSAGLYWTPAQMVAHQTSNGCNLEAGDLYGTGTISGDGATALGSLLEITRGGSAPFALPDGTSRTFLEDGDELSMTARCDRPGFVPIGFGACRGTVLPAPAG
ncbi:fumarylacetoacetase [Phreatobacter sp. AB_2022a]|uniref:fumarylacetoacetase n=1 Tax=Phreatobacter sp. AB_2022a TaxID=3003134 RepID=UPI002286E563|nr:fumarylacetoacetase [Phreatobacter sp. AB_2022a]MCZ0736873.1 fumarylacetoacetase [Phreatobacter sp. AB_2022a]